MTADLFFLNGIALADQNAVPLSFEGVPSVWWLEFRKRPATLAEVFALAAGREPAVSLGLAGFGMRPDIVAARISFFLKLHPELSDHAKLDLFRLFPFLPEDFNLSPLLAASDPQLDKAAAEAGPALAKVQKSDRRERHLEFSVVASTTATVERLAGGVVKALRRGCALNAFLKTSPAGEGAAA